ncbi:MAG: TIGR03936 family radical SAM-associated protein, partial [Lachnospiraceae bacterium]|nr:TIGR03936 family radical SAM-associated protein [Lachnospiraceae bacterium]
VMVEGIEVTSYRKLKDTDKKAMSLVAAADYKVYLKNGYEVPQINYEEAYREFYVEPHEILITKQTKKSEKVMDLKKLLYDFQILYEEGKPVFYLKVCTGSTDNVKPELVLEAFYQSMGLVLDPLSIQIHRLDVYGWRGEGLVSLGEMGEVIE